MKETPAAQEAFEDYYGMGPERSLVKLRDQYEERRQAGVKPASPTVNIRTLQEWSAKHNWQQRIIDRVEQDAAEVRKQMQERLIGVSKRVAAFIEVELTRLLERLRDSDGEILAASVADVEKLAKLYYQVAGQPLADRREIEHGGSLNVKHSGGIDLTDEPTRNLVEQLEDRLAESHAGDAGNHAD